MTLGQSVTTAPTYLLAATWLPLAHRGPLHHSLEQHNESDLSLRDLQPGCSRHHPDLGSVGQTRTSRANMDQILTSELESVEDDQDRVKSRLKKMA